MTLLLRGGRVVDPGTGLDAVSDVLVTGDRVAAVGTDLAPVPGSTVLDVRGCV
jgi:predicted amidohydrolase